MNKTIMAGTALMFMILGLNIPASGQG